MFIQWCLTAISEKPMNGTSISEQSQHGDYENTPAALRGRFHFSQPAPWEDQQR